MANMESQPLPMGWTDFVEITRSEDWEMLEDKHEELTALARNNPEAVVAVEILLDSPDGSLRALGGRVAAELAELPETTRDRLTRNMRNHGYLLAKHEAALALYHLEPDLTLEIWEAVEAAQWDKVTQYRAENALRHAQPPEEEEWVDGN